MAGKYEWINVDGQRVVFDERNPHRMGSAIWKLYEAVKVAETVQEARSYGASAWELKDWFNR
eukprot:12414931-Karenia_brevis.AAC.1